MGVSGNQPDAAMPRLTDMPETNWGIQFEYRRWPIIVLMPVINLFALAVGWRKRHNAGRRIKQYSRFFDGLPPLRRIRDGAARWPALDEIYNWQQSMKGINGFFEALWLNIRNCQAVRNRYRIVTKLIRKEVEMREGKAKILSIASGSAQIVFEAVAEHDGIEVLCIDSDQTAIEYSKRLAQQYGVKNVEWRCGNVLSPGSLANGFTPDIVEVVGLFDYLTDAIIAGLLRRMQAMAAKDATILTAHIHPNSEEFFLANVVDWEMHYRSLDHLKELMERGGFEQCRYFTEPHGIHTVVIGRRWDEVCNE